MRSWSFAIARACPLLCVFAGACSRGAPVLAADAGDLDVGADVHDASLSDAGPPLASSCTFFSCVRRADWAASDSAYASLSEAEKKAPAVAIARARVLVGLGRVTEALTALADVEPNAGAFADTILRVRVDAVRADAAAVRRSPDVAKAVAQILATSADSRARLEAVPLLDDRAAADATLNKLLKAKNVPKDVAIAARRLRAARGGDGSEADVRWLYVNAPMSTDVEPKGTLSVDEWRARADALARQGSPELALESNARAEQSATKDAERYAIARQRAYVLYKSRARYLEAAEQLTKLARAGGTHADEDAFHASRSLSRADRDDEAIAGYEALARSRPKSEWGMRAAYFVGYLHALHGEWAKSEIALTQFLSMRPKIAEARDAARFLALAAYAQEKWPLARSRFRALSAGTKSSDEALRATYLAALSDVRAGGKEGQDTWRSIAAREPFSFSGVMARSRLRETNQDVPSLPKLSAVESAAPLTPIAAALHAAGLDDDAEASLASQLGRAPIREACASFEVTDRAHLLFSRASAISPATIERGERWAWSCLYPSPYKVWIAEQTSPPPSLVWAVMRQESGFHPRATSPSLARGLLQLVDDTAKAMESELALTHHDSYDPKHNIALGSKYISNLLDRFKGQVPLAVAAYNAGPEAIARWLARANLVDVEVFVEFIPYHETRNYAARVISNYARYLWLKEARELQLPTKLSPPNR